MAKFDFNHFMHTRNARIVKDSYRRQAKLVRKLERKAQSWRDAAAFHFEQAAQVREWHNKARELAENNGVTLQSRQFALKYIDQLVRAFCATEAARALDVLAVRLEAAMLQGAKP